MTKSKRAGMRSMEYAYITHPFPPVYDEKSEILILGSFPSVKSREQKFFYGHPGNRFWQVTAAVFQTEVPQTIEEKRQFLLKNHIAVWDVIASCDIKGSSDNSIKNAVPTDIREILRKAKIRQIYTNGQTAGKLYQKFQREFTGRDAVILPSTSPANAAWSTERLIEAWGCILAHGKAEEVFI